jgi:site-specific recombinase XerD
MTAMMNTPLEFKPLPHADEYLTELEIQLRSADYIRKIRTALGHFANFVRPIGVVHPQQITRDVILQFQASLHERGWAHTTQVQTMKYLKGWVNWLADVGHIDANPWIRIKTGSYGKKPNPIEYEEVEALFLTHRKQAMGMDPFAYHRREAVLTVMYMWGLRIHEVEALNIEDVDLRKDFVRTINKGGGTKHVPYTPEIKTIIKRYLPHRGRYLDRNAAPEDRDALFLSLKGTRYSIASMRLMITQLADHAGVKVNPHRLRDTAGTHMLDADMPVERVMKVLGHSRREQTLAYARVNDPKVYESFVARDSVLKRFVEGEQPPAKPDLRIVRDEDVA